LIFYSRQFVAAAVSREVGGVQIASLVFRLLVALFVMFVEYLQMGLLHVKNVYQIRLRIE